MFEVLKIFVEQAFKLVDFKALAASRKLSNQSDIGKDLFALYSSLNAIYVYGKEITEALDRVLARYEHNKQKSKDIAAVSSSSLEFLLWGQRQNIINFSHDFKRLYMQIDVVNPKASREMTLFLSTKNNIVQHLIHLIAQTTRSRVDGVRTSLVLSPSSESQLVKLIERRFLLEQGNNYGDEDFRAELQKSSVQEERIRLSGFGEREIEIIKRYLVERQPRHHLETLQNILEEFHTTLTSNFKAEDILLKVGDGRVRNEQHALHWHPRRWR